MIIFTINEFPDSCHKPVKQVDDFQVFKMGLRLLAS